MSNDEDRFINYRSLLADIERLADTLKSRFARQITCHLGCTGCCYQQLTLSPVEADFVRAAIRELPADKQQRVMRAARALKDGRAIAVDGQTACPLLDGTGCAIYQSRPVICRTHGFPITFKDEQSDETYLDVCPLNFAEEGELAALTAPDTIDIDRVNLRLAAVNFAYCRDHKGDAQQAGDRRAIAEILLDALADK